MSPDQHAPAGARLLAFLIASVVAGAVLAGLAVPLVASSALVARAATNHFDSLPTELQAAPLPQRSTVLDANGKLLASFYDQNRVQVPLTQIAPIMRAATVAIEDSRFYQHGGVDLRGILRAAAHNSTSDSVQGASTLTQQYVKNVRLLSATTDAERQAATDRSLSRKLQEARYAIALERQLSKDQILERYLNIAYFGAGAYGVQAAAKRYFSVNAAQLTLPQAALLAGVIRNPYGYDPTRNPKLATQRRDVVLARMAELGDITSEQARVAMAAPLTLKPSTAPNGCVNATYAPFFCDYVVREIENDPAFGATVAERRDRLYEGGLTIRTTLDPKAQNAAQQAVQGDVGVEPSNKQVAAAIAMVKPGTGDIVAMAINRPYNPDPKVGTQINYAAGSNGRGFQAGSTFKPFVLAAAVKQGIPLQTKINSPNRLDVRALRFQRCDGQSVGYTGLDYVSSSTGSGLLNVWTGTSRSNNTFYLQLEARTGLCEPTRIAAAAGIKRADGQPLSDAHASFVFGTDETTPLSLADAYATFAARGRHCAPRAIVSVTDRSGKTVKQNATKCDQVIDPKQADVVNAVLQSVIDGPDPYRTAKALTLGRPAAGKTGTTNSNVALWFAGYTPDLAAAVWVGDPRGSNGLSDHVVHGKRLTVAYGGKVAGPIWKAAMLGALRGVPPHSFEPIDQKYDLGERVTVPDVSGLTVADATQTLADAGLQPGAQVPTPSALPVGTVLGTQPAAGSSVRTGSNVDLLISDGNPPPPAQPTPPPAQPTQPAQPPGQPTPPGATGGAQPPGQPIPPGNPTGGPVNPTALRPHAGG